MPKTPPLASLDGALLRAIPRWPSFSPFLWGRGQTRYGNSFLDVCTCDLVLLPPTARGSRGRLSAQLLLRPTVDVSLLSMFLRYQITSGPHPRPVEGARPSNLNCDFRGNEAAVANFESQPFLMKTQTSVQASLVSRTFSHPNAKRHSRILVKENYLFSIKVVSLKKCSHEWTITSNSALNWAPWRLQTPS